MTDKEIARWIRNARWWASLVDTSTDASGIINYEKARQSVACIHHVINSINWED